MLLYFLLFMFFNINYAYLQNLPQIINIKLKIIEKSANILPNIDIFGHKILEENNSLISQIIHIDKLPIELKKDLIITIVKFTELGDSFGNIVLKNYEYLIDYLL